jgi:hypothetical protein
MRLRVLVGVLAVAAVLPADVLTLKDGRKIEGAYLGGSSRQIRMAVGDEVKTFDLTEAVSLQFGAPAAEPAPAAPPEKPAATPQAQAAAAASAAEIPAGTQIVVRMIDAVDSETDKIGQTYRAAVDEPVVVNGQEVIPKGADAAVKLIDDKQAGKLTGKTEIRLDMVSITVNGRQVDVLTSDVVQSTASRTKSTAAVVGGTAALGAIIGAIAGGGRGAAIGATSGAGAGAAVQVLTKGPKVKVPSESRLSFTLEQPVRL